MFVLHKNEEKTEQNSASFRKPTSIERGLRPNGYFPLMRQPLNIYESMLHTRLTIGLTIKPLRADWKEAIEEDFEARK